MYRKKIVSIFSCCRLKGKRSKKKCGKRRERENESEPSKKRRENRQRWKFVFDYSVEFTFSISNFAFSFLYSLLSSQVIQQHDSTSIHIKVNFDIKYQILSQKLQLANLSNLSNLESWRIFNKSEISWLNFESFLWRIKDFRDLKCFADSSNHRFQ